MLPTVSFFCTNNFFNLEFILLKIRFRGYPLSNNNLIHNSRFLSLIIYCGRTDETVLLLVPRVNNAYLMINWVVRVER